MFRTLLQDSRVDPSANNNDLLQLAILHGAPSFVRMLLADERVKPAGALQLAAIHVMIQDS